MVGCLRPQIRNTDGKEHKTQKPGHSMWKSARGRENPRHFRNLVLNFTKRNATAIVA